MPISSERCSNRRPLLYLDFAAPREPIAELLAARGWGIQTARSIPEAHRLIEAHSFLVGVVAATPDTPATDLEHLVLANGGMEWVALLPAPPYGAQRLLRVVSEAFFDYVTPPYEGPMLLQVVGHAHGKAALRREFRCSDEAPHSLIGESEAMRRLSRVIHKAGANDAPLLVQGEAGTGKEVAARAVHAASRRAERPFVVVDCASASPKQALLDAAQGGTVFLDEVGDLPRELQANILRILQEGAVGPSRATRKNGLDARVVAATRIDLERLVASGQFREDLYYRLKVMHFDVPPLRERLGDSELLARHFFQRFAAERSPGVRGFSYDALRAMSAYRWPGNVRELLNRVRRAMVMSESALISAADLGLAERCARPNAALGSARAAAEKSVVESALRAANGNISRAARALGVSRVTLYRLMEKYGVLPRGPLVSKALQERQLPEPD